MTHWKRFRYWLEELGCRTLVWALPKLSRRGVVALGQRLGAWAYRLDARGRAVALENLECVFGDRFSPEQRARIARASYQNFVQTMIDLFWARRLRLETFAQYIEVEGYEPIRQRLEQEGRGAVFLCVHQGNWEWANLACGYLGSANMVVAENFKNPRLTAVFKDLRQNSGQTVIAQDHSMLRMLRAVKRGATTGMLIDLNLPPSQAATVIEGFGRKLCVPMLHAVLAQRAGALLVPVMTEPQPDGRCRVRLLPALECAPGESVAALAQRAWAIFEPLLVERPESWLWAYKHFRYRPKGAAVRYPSYSNESGKFEKLLRKVM